MAEASDSGKGSRWVRVDGAIRFIDAPNSRLGLEVDLSRLPWDLFDALGRTVTLLVQANDGPDPQNEGEERLARALHYVEHAAERTREFSQQDGGEVSDWIRAHETWDWLRSQLLDALARGARDSLSSGDSPASSEPGPAPPPSPSHGGPNRLLSDARAASVLSYLIGALDAMPVGLWEGSVTSLHPEAPTREEALRTVKGLIRTLREEGGAGTTAPAPAPPPEEAAWIRPPAPTTIAGPEPPREPEPAAPSPEPSPGDPDELSFDEARGFDEGYRMGRRVGWALGGRSPG